MLAIDVGDQLRVGRQLGPIVLVAAHSAWAGSDDDLEVWVDILATGLPSGPTNRALAWPQGCNRTVRFSPACLPETSTECAPLLLRSENVNTRGCLGGQPV